MGILRAIRNRRSVRSYKNEQIPFDSLSRVLEAARLAPSAMNYQPWRFIVVLSQDKKDMIARSGIFGRFMSQAPIIIVACGDVRSKYHVHDTCIALEHIVLAAIDEGLGTCWIVSFNEQTVKKLLNIPEMFSVVAIVSIGYPSEKRDFLSSFLHFFRPKKRLEEICYLDEFGKSLGPAEM